MSKSNPALEAAQQASQEMFAAIKSNTCFRVEAGAGAGKTYSLIEALNDFCKTKATEFAKNGEKVACITYTNAAKDVIRERTDNHPVIFTDTIHSFAWGLLKGFQSALRELIPSLGTKWQSRIKEAGGITRQKVVYDLGYPAANSETIDLHHDDVIKLMAKLLEKPKFLRLLKSSYPVLFIDEYQDTNSELADALVKNLIEKPSGLLVGLFGDHWQKIYGSNVCGLIEHDNIKEISKNSNFRSEKNIVACLNRMRPELLQHEADPDSAGEITVFHSNSFQGERMTKNHWQGDLPETNAHEYLLRAKSRLEYNGWDFASKHTKILMLTNNVLATEQGYQNLAGCFSDTDDYLKKNNHYIKFFLETVEPICEHFLLGHYGAMFSVLGAGHPRLSCQQDKAMWSADLNKLIEKREAGSIRDVLELLKATSRPQLSAKVATEEVRLARIAKAEGARKEIEDLEVKFAEKVRKLEAISYKEVISLYKYVEDKSPFSTKHGVKGAQFDNVLVICGRGWNHYNWNQLLEWLRASPPAKKAETFERNRNLFYVSCSRAKKRMALLFTQKLSEQALEQIEHIFGKDNVVGEP
ncbi:MAG: UvrD-helicase domain-containing protein [Gimesia chilikensis]|uniref:UvrD-helicase domain-containing protein n=1 Tax=Gimesia chilikensis TaxID=2605989 RepID=UPI0037AC8031